jgi:DNA-binding MarR family transcriptional regulator
MILEQEDRDVLELARDANSISTTQDNQARVDRLVKRRLLERVPRVKERDRNRYRLTDAGRAATPYMVYPANGSQS